MAAPSCSTAHTSNVGPHISSPAPAWDEPSRRRPPSRHPRSDRAQRGGHDHTAQRHKRPRARRWPHHRARRHTPRTLARTSHRPRRPGTNLPDAGRRADTRGLIGPNGAGTTTLLNVISGLERADGRTIVLDGTHLERWPAHLIARAGLGRTFQTPAAEP